MSDDLTKIPEDADGNGLTDRPSVRWLLWGTDALSAFVNGCLEGVKPGLFVGGVAAAKSDTLDVATLTANGGVGAGSAMVAMGLFKFAEFHKHTPMPNPFRP